MPGSNLSAKLPLPLRPLLRLPAARVLVAAELLLIARDHLRRLEPEERRRVLQLVRKAHGRPRNLLPSEREELSGLVAKADPRLFAGQIAQQFSPVPLPGRVVRGPKRR